MAMTACIAQQAQPLSGMTADYDSLMALIGDARIVMLGEATHGSREFYRERARITQRLIEEKGFDAVVLEASWEPVRRMDAFMRGEADDIPAIDAMGDFRRFPRWMWRNPEMRDFLAALRALNAGRRDPLRIYGMDLYSVPESADAVVRQVARHSIAAAGQARRRYACFDAYRSEPQFYGRDAEAGNIRPCDAAAAEQLAEMVAAVTDDDAFAAWQSARVVSGGAQYYRAMYRSDEPSWNVRERHMADTIAQVLERLERTTARSAKVVVWAHNIHQGDARATSQAEFGEISLGQIMRERYGEAAVLIGFSTYRGEVRAASSWGAEDRVQTLLAALPESWPQLVRALRPAEAHDFIVFLRGRTDDDFLCERRLDRAVGVNYLPHDELNSHYYHTRLCRQFDALIHIEVTSAIDTLKHP